MLPHRPRTIADPALRRTEGQGARDNRPRLTYSLIISNFPKFAKLKHRT
jgi:hypothetical protein